ncbi:hypothetical protein ET989_12315 [Propioniciclava sinopodophylli]|uniref:Peptidase S9A N-terminal domain-containing protein n=1 Tax=Propioniciclava sinopodophylli TaxID=1837344 RepID=A0A4Q9KCW5_9ACTN|nr:hypothetical protein [Propioniciclava sinopodophylli]TBT83082.1 hypothetical protein ET989_12315 [Propioniciclava sinopodophylli]
MPYPHTRRDDLVENLHGTQVADPYRWLEDADDPAATAWVAEQQAHAEAALSELPARAWFTELMGRIEAVTLVGLTPWGEMTSLQRSCDLYTWQTGPDDGTTLGWTPGDKAKALLS